MLGKQSAGLKPRTVRYTHTIIHAALDDAVRWRRIPLNPADHANPPSASQAKPPEMRVWTADQLRRFVALNEGNRLYWPWFFLATTGCRRGEVLGLRWADVELSGGTAAIGQELIPLTKASGRGREGRIVSRTKAEKPRVDRTGHSDRGVIASLASTAGRRTSPCWCALRRPRSCLLSSRRKALSPRGVLRNVWRAA